MTQEDRRSWDEETIPVLRVADVRTAIRWYRRLGFSQEWEYRAEPHFPAFSSLRRGLDDSGIRLFLSEHNGDAMPHGLVYIRVADVAPIANEFDVGVIDLEDRCEVQLEDPDGNRLRINARTGKRVTKGYSRPNSDL
jgi:catechol 2,3-dioxygenase-like lactoylglutathione lyase family enzyme